MHSADLLKWVRPRLPNWYRTSSTAAAVKVTTQAADECRAKRLSGQLPSHAASAQCANPPMLQAFNAAHYRYMDLIQFFAAKRLELATKIDRGEITEQQGQVETQEDLMPAFKQPSGSATPQNNVGQCYSLPNIHVNGFRFEKEA